jgi:hypothetical protein
MHCGRYFKVDRRVGDRQKACHRPQCRKARKRESQQRWKQNNPGYFADHYRQYVKPWRQRKRQLPDKTKEPARSSVIKDTIPPAKPYRRLVFLVPAPLMIKDEILLRRVDRTTFAASGP